jgi:hypothetical protein
MQDIRYAIHSRCTHKDVLLCYRIGFPQVAVVRQTDTAALRKASKGTGRTASGGGGNSSSTFSRAVAGIFTPGVEVVLLMTRQKHD